MTDFDTAFKLFLEGAQAKVNAYLQSSGFDWKAYLGYTDGPKYIRVYKSDHGQRSLYCFIDKSNGNVLKGKGWKAPERKNPRSNIYDADSGMSGVTHHGTTYLR